MTSFRYQARGPSGRIERGVLEASSAALALERLRRRELTALALAPANEAASTPSRLSDVAARDLARTLAQLLRAGLPFSQGLKFASEELSQEAGSAASRMREAAERGESASSALSELSGPQARLLKGVVGAGETSGKLAEALEVAAGAFARAAELRSRIGTALIYPAFVIVATLATLTCFVLFVVPAMAEAFSGSEERLPASTRALLHTSGWLRAHGSNAVAMASALIVLGSVTPTGRRLVGSVLNAALASPAGFGIAQRLDFAAFASLAALSLQAGVPAPGAFEAAASAVRNEQIRNRLQHAVSAIRLGERPSVAFAHWADPPRSFTRLTHVGEETGKLADALKQASALLASEAEQRLERLGAVAGPVVTLLLGLLVAGVVMSLFLGLLSMSELATV
jgi:general secretion pathway protein F